MWTYASKYSKVAEAPDPWSIYDSENHDAQAESFYFLAAQIFKNTPGYSKRKYADHRTAAQQYKAWHDHWSNYFDERAKRGLFIEVGAPTYHGYTLGAILNIYNFADDPMLRQQGGHDPRPRLRRLRAAELQQHLGRREEPFVSRRLATTGTSTA